MIARRAIRCASSWDTAPTITTVAFRSFDFDAANTGHMSLKMNGIAESVNSVALQADLFSKGGIITSPIFSNINRQSGGVLFNFSGIVNTNAMRYAQSVAEGNPTSTLFPPDPSLPSLIVPVKQQ